MAASFISPPVGKRISCKHFSESMKLILVALVALLLVGVPVNAALTSQDIAYGKVISSDAKLIAADLEVFQAALNSNNTSLIRMAHTATKKDIDSAMAETRLMPVSEGWQLVKDDFTTGLTILGTGLDDIYVGKVSCDQSKTVLGISKMWQGIVYISKSTRDMAALTADPQG
jgi:hypothetical protein